MGAPPDTIWTRPLFSFESFTLVDPNNMAGAGKVESQGAPKRHTQNPVSLGGFVVSFWRLVLFGAGHVVQVDL